MSGTNSAVNRPMERMPPRITAPAPIASTRPVAQVGTPNCARSACGDGVGLHHVADAEGGDRGGDREEDREQGAERALDALGQIELRPAGLLAGRVDLAEAHAEERLGVLGRHADEAGHPHPEQRARPAEVDGGGDAGDVADADVAASATDRAW
jgi:hypothetical protein